MGNQVFMQGNQAMAESAIRAGCKLFFGYPITPQTTLVFGDYLRKLNFEEIDFACHYETAPSRARHWVNSYLCGQAANIIARGDCGAFLDTSGWYDLPSPAFAAGGGLTGMTPDGEVRLGEAVSSTRLACGDGLGVDAAVT